MFLSNKQHTQLRTLVMDFEVPYRTYVASEIISQYRTPEIFLSELTIRAVQVSAYNSFSKFASLFGKMKADSSKIYDALKNAKKAGEIKIIEDDIDVPFVSQLNVLILVFGDLFQSYLKQFYDLNEFWSLASEFHYVRNKLSHPACKTLDDKNLERAISFVETSNMFLKLYGDDCYWLESSEGIEKKAKALATSTEVIPVKINNFNEMPFPDMSLVCRDKEIEEIKSFVYGKPGALRKKTSMCIFGYGGVGKTALALEVVKHIVRDLIDETTMNAYSPDFILFFSAKREELRVSSTSGNIERNKLSSAFSSVSELKQTIFEYLKISDYSQLDKNGLIIIDNLETLDSDERQLLAEFVEEGSPQQVQYIITSRNEEGYQVRKPLSGFNDFVSGKKFVLDYIAENDLDLSFTDNEIKMLLDMTKGNTLVLVLCLKRLEQKFDTLQGLQMDLTKRATITKLNRELASLPANGYEIISEYMFKNTFEELEEIFTTDSQRIYSILSVLAVYPSKSVDIYTLSLLTKQPYNELEELMILLCRYLIVNKHSNEYRLNEFAEKYIILRFLPDKETFLSLSNEIEASTRKIKQELRELDEQINRNQSFRKIMSDWHIVSEGDKIAAAKAFKLYGEVKLDCQKNKFSVESALDEAKILFSELEKTTMHPYIKYQKARIFQMIEDSGYFIGDLSKERISAFKDAIWIIKTNPQFSIIQKTKSYASILWLLGYQLVLIDENNRHEAEKYFEDSKEIFEALKIRDNEFYQCASHMARNCLEIYKQTKKVAYLRQSRQLCEMLWRERRQYSGSTYSFVLSLRNELPQYGRY
ncbi:MAG: ATP-binding protein [Bacilli bacterium]|nr:ATP-binding protein [Bacilli bacterium]